MASIRYCLAEALTIMNGVNPMACNFRRLLALNIQYGPLPESARGTCLLLIHKLTWGRRYGPSVGTWAIRLRREAQSNHIFPLPYLLGVSRLEPRFLYLRDKGTSKLTPVLPLL